MKKLIIGREYLATAIFCPELDKMGHIDTADLPLSSGLIKDINDWYEEYQNTFNNNDPTSSGFKSVEDNQSHIEKGKAIAKRIQSELGKDYKIEFQS